MKETVKPVTATDCLKYMHMEHMESDWNGELSRNSNWRKTDKGNYMDSIYKNEIFIIIVMVIKFFYKVKKRKICNWNVSPNGICLADKGKERH